MSLSDKNLTHRVSAVQFLQQGEVGAFGKSALLINQS